MTGSVEKALELTFGEEIDASPQSGVLFLDEAFTLSVDAVVQLSFAESEQITDAGTLSQLHLSFKLIDGEEIYSATSYAYTPNGGGENE